MVWIGDRAPEAVVHEWLWQPQGLWVASRGFCSSCEMRVGAVEARCVRAASPTHALEHGVLSRSPSAAERRSPTSCNNEFKVCLSVCLFFEHRNRGEIGPTVMAQSARRSSASAHAWTPSCQRLPRAPQHAHPA